MQHLIRVAELASVATVVAYSHALLHLHVLCHGNGSLALPHLVATPEGVTQGVIGDAEAQTEFRFVEHVFKEAADPSPERAVFPLIKAGFGKTGDIFLRSFVEVPAVILRKDVDGLTYFHGSTVIDIIKELREAVLSNEFAQALVGYALMENGCLRVGNAAGVRKDNNHFPGLGIIPSEGVAHPFLRRCVGIVQFVHVLNDADVLTQTACKVLHFLADVGSVRAGQGFYFAVQLLYLFVGHCAFLS